jgi:glutamyl-tRNA reductase
MKVSIFGINHKTAPTAIREKLVFDQDLISQALESFKQELNSEVVILSTCNRTEIYSSKTESELIEKWLSKYHQVAISHVKKYSYFKKNKDAFLHALNVASGLDSMIVGEPQIFGQIKQAFKISENSNVVSKNFHNFFTKVFQFAKEVRSKTNIGANPTTIASSALNLVQKLFGNISDLSILFIGAGEMNTLTAKYFIKKNPKKVMIANRSKNRGESLAKIVKGDSCLISEIPMTLHNYDIVISCTGSQLPIIGLGLVENIIKKRKHKPMFFIDLAVPADIEKEVGNLDDIFLYNLEDLAKLSQENLHLRENELSRANKFSEDIVNSYYASLANKNTSLTLTLQDFFEDIKEIELKKALDSLKKGTDPEKVCHSLSRNIIKKLLHYPTKSLNQDKSAAEFIKQIYLTDKK